MLSHFSCVRLCATLWTVARQAPLSMGFSREEYWSGLPCPSPGDLPDPRIKPASFKSPALAGSLDYFSKDRKGTMRAIILVFQSQLDHAVAVRLWASGLTFWGFKFHLKKKGVVIKAAF